MFPSSICRHCGWKDGFHDGRFPLSQSTDDPKAVRPGYFLPHEKCPGFEPKIRNPLPTRYLRRGLRKKSPKADHRYWDTH